MHVRINTLHGDKGQVDAAVEFVESTARPAAEAVPGNRGMATLIDRAAGVTLVASYWDSADAMKDSEPAVAEVRKRVVEVGGGDVTVERYEVAVAKRQKMPAKGATVRILRIESDPGRAEEIVAFYRDEVLPELLGLAGVCSAQMLIDRESGRGMSITAWDDEDAVAAAREALERMRSAAIDRMGATITGLDVYTLVNTTVGLD